MNILIALLIGVISLGLFAMVFVFMFDRFKTEKELISKKDRIKEKE